MPLYTLIQNYRGELANERERQDGAQFPSPESVATMKQELSFVAKRQRLLTDIEKGAELTFQKDPYPIPFQRLFELAHAHFNLGERAEGQVLISYARLQAKVLEANAPAGAEGPKLSERIADFQKAVNEHYGFSGEEPKLVDPMGPQRLRAVRNPRNHRNDAYDAITSDADSYDRIVVSVKNKRSVMTAAEIYDALLEASPEGRSKQDVVRGAAPLTVLKKIAKNIAAKKGAKEERLPVTDTMAAVQTLDNSGDQVEAQKLTAALLTQVEYDLDKRGEVKLPDRTVIGTAASQYATLVGTAEVDKVPAHQTLEELREALVSLVDDFQQEIDLSKGAVAPAQAPQKAAGGRGASGKSGRAGGK